MAFTLLPKAIVVFEQFYLPQVCICSLQNILISEVFAGNMYAILIKVILHVKVKRLSRNAHTLLGKVHKVTTSCRPSLYLYSL